MDAAIVITVKAYWIGRWFVHPLARAFVLIDGAERQVEWSTATRIAVEPGRHMVAAGIRYKGIRSTLLGARAVPAEVKLGKTVDLLAVNGVLNHEPFYVTIME